MAKRTGRYNEDVPALEAEIERLRAGIVSLLEMPAACATDDEVIENVNRRKRAMDLIGAHRILRDDQQKAPTEK